MRPDRDTRMRLFTYLLAAALLYAVATRGEAVTSLSEPAAQAAVAKTAR